MAGNGQFTKGPILLYVVFPDTINAGGGTTGYFLGTNVTSPKERGEFYEIPVYNDLGGRSARFQSVGDGEEWRISTTLNRFDLNIARTLRYLKSGIAFSDVSVNPAAFPLTGLPFSLGTQSSLARGSLVIGQQDFQLILISSYAGTTAAGLPIVAAADLNGARGYASCSITAYEEDQDTTRVTEVSMAIEARGVFNPLLTTPTGPAGIIYPSRGFGIYYEGVVPIPTITLNPVN